MLLDLIEPRDSEAGSRSPWYAVYTRHKHEKTVAQILTSKRLEIFLPLYETAHRWKDRTKLLSLPLFPCYIFLKGGLDRRLDIVTTPGLFGLVSIAGQPAAIPHPEIQAIRQAVESGARVDPHLFVKCGERVRVKCGPLTGLEGILVRKRNLFRLIVSVEMLGKAVAVEVDAVLVERITGSPLSVRAGRRSVVSASSERNGVPAA